MTSTEEPSTGKPVRFTVARNEALDAIGITEKILQTWQKEGVFVPELGPRTRRFTQRDYAKLEYLNHLRSEVALPIPVVKRLLKRFIQDPSNTVSPKELKELQKQGISPFPSKPLTEFPFLDLKEIKLINVEEAFKVILRTEITRFFNSEDSEPLELWMTRITTSLFYNLDLKRGHNHAVYIATRDRVMKELREAELASRFETYTDENDPDFTESYGFSPRLPDDPVEFSPELVESLKSIKRSKVSPYSYEF